MITFEALAEELGLTTWFASLLMEETRLYAGGVPERVVPEGMTIADYPPSAWVELPVTDEFADLMRARFPAWSTED